MNLRNSLTGVLFHFCFKGIVCKGFRLVHHISYFHQSVLSTNRHIWCYVLKTTWGKQILPGRLSRSGRGTEAY